MIDRNSKLMRDGNYLPAFMRDFHNQKRLFKAIQGFYSGRIKEDRYLEGLNWVMAHVYVVDLFLWFMALHGYTLQMSRAKEDFCDIDKFLKRFDQEQLDQLKELLEGRAIGKPVADAETAKVSTSIAVITRGGSGGESGD